MLPGFEYVVGQPPPDGGSGEGRDDAAADRFAGQFRAAPPGQWDPAGGGQLAGERFDLRHYRRGEAARAAGAWPVGQAVCSLLAKPAAPLADGVDMKVQTACNGRIAGAVSGRQHDPGPEHLTVWRGR